MSPVQLTGDDTELRADRCLARALVSWCLFHVTIVRLTDLRSRRRENVRPLSLRTFACSTLRRRSYADRSAYRIVQTKVSA